MRVSWWLPSRKFLAALLVLVAAYTPLKAEAANNASEFNERLGQGINLASSHRIEAADKPEFKREDFEEIASAGFDSVRIFQSFAENSDPEAPWTISPDYLERTRGMVDNAVAAGLPVVLSFYGFREFHEDSEGNFPRFAALWKQVAEEFASYGVDVLAFELLNEPKWPLTPQAWNATLRKLVPVIRRSNPDRILLISPAGAAHATRLPYLELPEPSGKIVVTVHMYEPFEFTHSGAWWGEKRWPAGATWEMGEEERLEITRDLDYAKNFSAKTGAPINVGEWGAIKTSDPESRVRWARFVSNELNARGFSHHYWNMLGKAFGLYDSREEVWEDGMLEAVLAGQS